MSGWDQLIEGAGDDTSLVVYWLFDGHPERGEGVGVPSAVISCIPCLAARDGGAYIQTLRRPDGADDNIMALIKKFKAEGRSVGGCRHGRD